MGLMNRAEWNDLSMLQSYIVRKVKRYSEIKKYSEMTPKLDLFLNVEV